MSQTVIAIDGPAASGKGTISKVISKKLNSIIWILGSFTE